MKKSNESKIRSALIVLIGLMMSSTVYAEEEMSLSSKKSGETSFDMPSLPTGEFSATEEKERRAKALKIARRAQERENAKARAHNSKISPKQKRKVAAMSRHHAYKNKIRHDRSKVVSDSDF